MANTVKSSSDYTKSNPSTDGKVTYAPFSVRAFLIGLLLIPVLIFWVEYTEIVAQGPDLAAMSLPMAVVFALMVLIAVNLGIKKLSRKLALTQPELMLITTMNTTSVGICGIGMMQFLTPALVGWKFYATPENRWANWHYLIPRWAVADPSVINDYFHGKSSFFTPEHLAGWMQPIAIWTAFIFTLLFCMYCICVLVRRQWVEGEKLIFPIVQIPLEISHNGGDTPLWRSKVLWTGIAVPMILESMAVIHFTMLPTFPYVPIKPEPSLQLDPYLTMPPWSAIGYTMLTFYPLVIGLTYLVSLDVSFSCWFFYLFTKIETVTATALGYRDAGAPPSLAHMPYIGEQSVGAWVGLALFSLHLARPHLARAWRKAFRGDTSVDDTDEPMSYRTAYLGLIVSAMLLIGFGMALGLSALVSVLFFGLFFLLALTFTRIRAEAGLPWGQGASGLAHGTLVNFGGTSSLNVHEMTAFSLLRWVDTDWRCLAQPSQLEAMKIAGATGPNRIHPRHLTVVVLISILVGTLAAWASCLGIYYHIGAASAHVNGWRTLQGLYPFGDLQDWLIHPKLFDPSRIGASVVGLGIVSLLSFLRTRFVWWPLHPIGYAVGFTDTMGWIWFPVLLSWLCKTVILRYGGIKLYRQALPFFMGLVLGDYAISGLWALYFLAIGSSGYRTFPN